MRKISIVFFALFLTILLVSCKKSSPTEPEPPVPIPITLSFEVYNHMNGLINGAGFSRSNVMSESSFTIRINELGVNGVDDKRLILYSDGFGENLGFSNTGELTFVVPRQDTKYNIVLMEALQPPATYDWMDNQDSELYLNKRHYVVYREDRDGQPPANWDSRFNFDPEAPWKEGFNQHNQALNRGWIKWGSFTRKPEPNDGEGDFSYGYGDCNGYMGWHAGSYINVNAKILTSHEGFLRIGNEEIFENVTATNDIDGDAGSWDVMTDDGGDLNYVGQCLLVYVFAKDRASMN